MAFTNKMVNRKSTLWLKISIYIHRMKQRFKSKVHSVSDSWLGYCESIHYMAMRTERQSFKSVHVRILVSHSIANKKPPLVKYPSTIYL